MSSEVRSHCEYCKCTMEAPMIPPAVLVCNCPCHWKSAAREIRKTLIRAVVQYHPIELKAELEKQGVRP